MTRTRVLVLARNYPNPVLPTLGIWTDRLTQAAQHVADTTVIAPIPWSPPGLPVEYFSRFRKVPRRRDESGVPVHHPRVLTGPGYSLHQFEADLWYRPIRQLAARLHAARAFDIIHAHFIYPEGVIAARLSEHLGLPVVTTEQAPWDPWLKRYPRVGKQVRAALPAIQRVMAVSEFLRRNIHSAIPNMQVPVDVVHNVVDDSVFDIRNGEDAWDPDRLLFVGVVRRVKGLDVLVRALHRLVEHRPTLRLVVVGAAYYRGYARDEAEVRGLVDQLGLMNHVTWVGQAQPSEVATHMRRSAVVVVPSRSETFSAVTAEALASGTPVVATRCGGPEEIVTPETGCLVPKEDPAALADAIDEMLRRRPSIAGASLRQYAVAQFGRATATRRLGTLYDRVLGII